MNAPILKAALKPRGKDERKLSMKAVDQATGADISKKAEADAPAGQ